MNKSDITILTLWDWEKINVNMHINDFLDMQKTDVKSWRKEFYISDLLRTINYSDIKWKQWKTQYIALPEPEKPKTLLTMSDTEKKNLQKNDPDIYYQMEQEEKKHRANRNKIIKDLMENSKERRTKKFMEERTIDLKKLAATERSFWLKTTESKLLEWEQFTRDNLKNNI